MKWQDVRKAAATKIAEAKALQEAADKETRNLTDDELLKVNACIAEAQKLDAQADTLKRLDESIAARKEPEDEPTPIAKGEPSVPAAVRDVELERRAGFRTFGDFAAAVHAACPQVQGDVDHRLGSLYAAASGMSQGVGADGGYLVPPSFATTIWDGLNTGTQNLLSLTDNYTVQGESLTFVANAETNRATGSRYGGIRAYWLAEADQVTKSKPTFRKLKLEPQQLGVFVYVTDKLLRNSAIALEQYLTRAATDEINFLVSDSIINGDGAGKPLGILGMPTGATSLIQVTKETGQAAATVVYENIIKMWIRLHPTSKRNAVWLITPAAEAQLLSMSLGVGAAGMPVYLPPGGLSAAPYGTLLGRPVISCDYCAALGTVGDVLLVDLKAYATGNKAGIEGASSIHLRFDYAETCFRFLFEIDGQAWVNSPITPYKGTANTLSPFVAIATRA